MNGTVVNNKEGRPLEYYCGVYRQLDPAAAALRCGAEYDENASEFALRFMGNDYRAAFPEFSLRMTRRGAAIDAAEGSDTVKILLMRYIIYGQLQRPDGDFIAYRQAPWGEAYMRSFDGRCIKRLAFSYGNSPDRFSELMELLGGRRIKGGDAAYELEFMNELFMRFIVWSGDDEFPPSAQILFSDNFPSAFSAEDMAVAGDIVMGAMKKAAALCAGK